METKSYYAIIPANVRYDKNITANAKLLYGEITSLCNERGFCWANNKYFSELYEVSEVSISKWINSLVNSGYLKTEIDSKENKRYIFLSDMLLTKVNDPLKKSLTPPLTKVNDPLKEKFMYNNKLNNKTNNSIDFENVRLYFNKVFGKQSRVVSEKAKSNFKQRLKEGYSKDDIKKVIINASLDNYHIENKFKYITLEFLSRTDKFERYASLETNQLKENVVQPELDLKTQKQTGTFNNY